MRRCAASLRGRPRRPPRKRPSLPHLPFVMPGLDPGIHAVSFQCVEASVVDSQAEEGRASTPKEHIANREQNVYSFSARLAPRPRPKPKRRLNGPPGLGASGVPELRLRASL